MKAIERTTQIRILDLIEQYAQACVDLSWAGSSESHSAEEDAEYGKKSTLAEIERLLKGGES